MDRFTILTQRLHNQGLLYTSFTRPKEVVSALGAMQAQEYGYAKYAIGLRLNEIVDVDIEEAVNKGTILRTHVMRPTWHFVSPKDIRWLQMLTSPRVNQLMGHYNRKLGLDDALFTRSNKIIERALKGQNYLTRQELRKIVEKNGISYSVQKLAHLVMRAELDALICSGPRKGKQFTYALLEERAPKSRTLTREKALAELTKRYFASHGPATVHDFAWWSGLTTADVRKGIEWAKPKLLNETVDNQTYFFYKSTQKETDITDTVYFLPVYDEYTISYKTSRPLFYPAQPTPTFNPRENVAFNHSIVMGGRIVGMWKPIVGKKEISIQTHLFHSLTANEKTNLSTAAKQYGYFWGMPVTLK